MKSSNRNYCSATGCNVNSGANPNISIFRFPKDPQRCRRWAINTGRKDFEDKTVEYLAKNRLLCAKHFCDNQFMNPALKNKLVHDAIPSEFPNLPNKPLSLATKRKLPKSRSPTPPKQTPEWPLITEIIEDDNEEIPFRIGQDSKEENVPSPTPHKKLPETVFPTFTEYEVNKQVAGPSNVSQHLKLHDDVCRKRKNLKDLNRRLHLLKNKYKVLSKKQLILQCKQYLPKRALQLLSAQINMAGHSSNDRQRNPDMVLLALSIYYEIPEAYSFFAGILMLPSKLALKKWIHNLQFHPGINDTILLALEKKVETMSPLDRCCCICINEMAIKYNLKFGENEDLMTSYSDDGLTKNVAIANSAISILVKGIISNWKQPIGYTFSCKGKSSSYVLDILKAFISKLKSIGFHVMCIVSEMGENFCLLRKELQVTAEKPYFIHDNCKIFYIHDPPDLLKNTRAALRWHKVQFGDKTACWSDVVSVFKEDSLRNFKICPRVTKNHIAITRLTEMKVELAAQILSYSMAAAIETLKNCGRLSPDALGTAKFCDFFNKLFDCLNSSSKEDVSDKPYRSALRSGSVHWNFFKSAPAMLKSFRLTNVKGVDCTKNLKFIEGWLLTIASVNGLYEDLKKVEGFTCLHTRNVNQEGLENFFGKINQIKKNSGNLTPDQFKTAFQITCVNALMKTPPDTKSRYDADADALVRYDDNALMKKINSVLRFHGNQC